MKCEVHCKEGMDLGLERRQSSRDFLFPQSKRTKEISLGWEMLLEAQKLCDLSDHGQEK